MKAAGRSNARIARARSSAEWSWQDAARWVVIGFASTALVVGCAPGWAGDPGLQMAQPAMGGRPAARQASAGPSAVQTSAPAIIHTTRHRSPAGDGVIAFKKVLGDSTSARMKNRASWERPWRAAAGSWKPGRSLVGWSSTVAMGDLLAAGGWTVKGQSGWQAQGRQSKPCWAKWRSKAKTDVIPRRRMASKLAQSTRLSWRRPAVNRVATLRVCASLSIQMMDSRGTTSSWSRRTAGRPSRLWVRAKSSTRL